MVYSSKFVMALYLNGHADPERELANGVVKIPFGAEYTLRFRNKHHDRRAVVKIFIDGENVSGGGYVINANDKIDIRRHSDRDCAFRFVDLDSPAAVDAGKNGPNPDQQKGLIEAHFLLEKKAPVEHHHHHWHEKIVEKPVPVWPDPYRPWNPWKYPYTYGDGYTHSTLGGLHVGNSPEVTCSAGPTSGLSSTSYNAGPTLNEAKTTTYRGGISGSSCRAKTASIAPSVAPSPELRDGCTVEGSTTGQYFYSTWVDTETEPVVVKMFLQGYDAAIQQVEAPTPRKTNRTTVLEREVEELREKLANLEKEKLQQEIAEKEAKLKKKPRKKKSTK